MANGKTTITKSARRILRFLNLKGSSLSPLLILTHHYPDPDALASAFALQYFAAKCYGVESRIAYGGIIGRMENRRMVRVLKIPVHKFHKSDLVRYKKIALVDTQPGFENNPFPPNRRPSLIVDQHASLKPPKADLAVIDTGCGATSAILAKVLLMMKVPIPAPVATALAYGIMSDTLNLYRAPRKDVIKTYLDILPLCDIRALADIQNPERSRRFFATLQRGIQNAVVRRRLIVSNLGGVENPDLISQMADFFLSYKGMQWAFVTGRFEGRLHVSLRVSLKSTMEAGEILRDIFDSPEDAGGHGCVAGGSLWIGAGAGEDVWLEQENQLRERLVRRLRIARESGFYYPFRQKKTG